MKKHAMVVAGFALASLGLMSGPASAVGQNSSSSCGVGYAVSSTVQQLHTAGTNFGQAAKALGETPGDAIQAYHAYVKSTC